MNPYKAYQVQRQASSPRIEVLLQVYDRLLAVLSQAHDLLARNDQVAANPMLARARLAVTAMMGGVDLSYGEVPQNMVRLYEYVLHSLEQGNAGAVKDAIQILTTLREGLEGIRGEALALERTGSIPSLDCVTTFQATC
jgi:flagellar biosynthetic protein FliS